MQVGDRMIAKNMQIIALFLLLLLLVSCKKAETAAAPPPSEPASPLDSVISEIRKAAGNLTEQPSEQPSQTVYVPVETQQPDGTITKNYRSQCLVQKYKGLNVYCKFKSFWHNQSSLLSWYIPYSFVAFVAFILIILIIIWLWRNK